MKGYWVVAVQDVIKPDTWEQVLSSWGNYVEKSNGVVNPISFGPPKAVFESIAEARALGPHKPLFAVDDLPEDDLRKKIASQS